MRLHGAMKYEAQCKSSFFILNVFLIKVELTLVRFDHENKKVQLLLKAHQLLPALRKLNEDIQDE